jgi:hypothetical protein
MTIRLHPIFFKNGFIVVFHIIENLSKILSKCITKAIDKYRENSIFLLL